jgi:hypothetical protein
MSPFAPDPEEVVAVRVDDVGTRPSEGAVGGAMKDGLNPKPADVVAGLVNPANPANLPVAGLLDSPGEAAFEGAFMLKLDEEPGPKVNEGNELVVVESLELNSI